MQLRRLVSVASCMAAASGVLLPAFAVGNRCWHQRHGWVEQRQREEWRERAWREYEWRERTTLHRSRLRLMAFTLLLWRFILSLDLIGKFLALLAQDFTLLTGRGRVPR